MKPKKKHSLATKGPSGLVVLVHCMWEIVAPSDLREYKLSAMFEIIGYKYQPVFYDCTSGKSPPSFTHGGA